MTRLSGADEYSQPGDLSTHCSTHHAAGLQGSPVSRGVPDLPHVGTPLCPPGCPVLVASLMSRELETR
jgi:hypothetical protein